MIKIKNVLANIVDYIGRLMCPPHCICCDEQFTTDDDRVFCGKCYEEILSRMNIVSRPGNNSYVDQGINLLNYKCWYAHKIIAHAKYISSKPFLSAIGKLCKQSLEDHNLLLNIDIITFSPRRASQIRYYGFDQSEELGKALSSKTGIPCKALLKRVGSSKAQKKLKYFQRLKNVKGKFVCTEDVTGKKILLIDDVTTSGSTLNECAKMLKHNGATKVYVWTLASMI